MENNDQEILQRRAGLIAGWKNEEKSSGESLLVVEFRLIPELYAVESACVSEVLPLRNLTTIPGTPPFLVGIINLRGKIISVVDLKKMFSLPEKGISALNKILVLKHDQMEFGILTDEITGTRHLDLSTLSAPPATLQGAGADYLRGVTPGGIILLDANAILSSNSVIINQK